MVSPGRALASALVSLPADLTNTPPDAAHGLVDWVRALTRGDAGIREAGAAGSVPPAEPQPASIKARRVRVAGTLARCRRFTAGRPPGTMGRRHHGRYPLGGSGSLSTGKGSVVAVDHSGQADSRTATPLGTVTPLAAV